MLVQRIMLKGRPALSLVRFALPLMAGDMVNQLYTIADSLVVGRLIGVGAFAAVGAAGAVYWFILIIMQGVSQGFGTLMAQSFGAGNGTALRRSCALSLGMAFFAGAALSLIGLPLVKPVLILMRTPEEILDGAVIYLAFLTGGLSFVFLNLTLGAAFRALGDSKTPLYILAGSSVLNIGLDLLLLWCTPFGLGAVAAATVAAQALSALAAFLCLIRRPALGLRRGDLAPDRPLIRELLRLGIPLGLQNAAAALGGIVIQFVINGYGAAFIAGIAAAKRLYSLLFIAGGGIAGALAVFTAQNYGAGQFGRIRAGTAAAAGIMAAGLGLIIPLTLIFGEGLLGLFINGGEAEVREVLAAALGQLRVCVLLLPALYALFLYRAAIQGVGNSFIPMLSGIMEAAIRMLAVAALPLFLGPWGVYIAEPAGWLPLALLLWLAWKRIFREKLAGAL